MSKENKIYILINKVNKLIFFFCIVVFSKRNVSHFKDFKNVHKIEDKGFIAFFLHVGTSYLKWRIYAGSLRKIADLCFFLWTLCVHLWIIWFFFVRSDAIWGQLCEITPLRNTRHLFSRVRKGFQKGIIKFKQTQFDLPTPTNQPYYHKNNQCNPDSNQNRYL